MHLFKLYSIRIILSRNNLTNIYSKISKTGMNLWMFYTYNMIRSGRKVPTTDEKKVNAFCIVDWNHERSVVALDHFRES